MYTFFLLGLLVGLFFNMGMEYAEFKAKEKAQFDRWYEANCERLIEEGVLRVD